MTQYSTIYGYIHNKNGSANQANPSRQCSVEHNGYWRVWAWKNNVLADVNGSIFQERNCVTEGKNKSHKRSNHRSYRSGKIQNGFYNWGYCGQEILSCFLEFEFISRKFMPMIALGTETSSTTKKGLSGLSRI